MIKPLYLLKVNSLLWKVGWSDESIGFQTWVSLRITRGMEKTVSEPKSVAMGPPNLHVHRRFRWCKPGDQFWGSPCPCYSKCDLSSSSKGTAWEHARNVDSLALLQKHWTRIGMLTRLPDTFICTLRTDKPCPGLYYLNCLSHTGTVGILFLFHCFISGSWHIARCSINIYWPN